MKNNNKQSLSITIWLTALACDYLIIAFAFLIAYLWKWPAYPFSIFLLGIAQHGISVLGHDGAHGLVCRNKKLNDWLTQLLCFWPLLSDMASYRTFHWAHHKHTGEESGDPELELKQGRYKLPMTQKKLYRRFLFDMIGGSIPEFTHVLIYFTKRSNPIWAPSFILIFGSLSYYIGHSEFFILFMISKPTSFWAVFRLRIYFEHVDTEGTHRVKLALWQRLLFAPHNVWIHWEHHMHPQVPFWQLPKLREQYEEIPVIDFETLLQRTKINTEMNTNDLPNVKVQ